MISIQASKNSNEQIVFPNLQDQRQKQRPNIKIGQLVKTADFKKVISKGDGTNYSNELYTISEVIHHTIPSYRLNYSPERYNQNLLLPKKFTFVENKQVKKKLNLYQKKKHWQRMEFTEDQINEKHAKHCIHCSRKTLLPYEYDFTYISCRYNVIKRKYELSKKSNKKIIFIIRINYADFKKICICIEVYKIYEGSDYKKI